MARFKVNYPETILKKSEGFTNSEEYLNRLCNDTFLSFWSYPNVFRDQGRTNIARNQPKGDGKEVCDIFIFSDKNCAFSNHNDLKISWRRWYKKTVYASAKQVWGAERWIFSKPNNLFLDKSCSQKFPFKIPNHKEAIIHRIVVAHGANEESRRVLGGSGSLVIDPNISGNEHLGDQCVPFHIGHISRDKGFVHVFDDVSLEIVMRTLDTISDFTDYLNDKARLMEGSLLVNKAREEDLLAHYKRRIAPDGKHSFWDSEIGPLPGQTVKIVEGDWASFSSHRQRVNQIQADKISYTWDDLLEKFFYHITTGTSEFQSSANLQDQAEAFLPLARENRTSRRALAEALYGVLSKAKQDQRTTRLVKSESPNAPVYFFLILPRDSVGNYERYRATRRNLLGQYVRTVKYDYPEANLIIGIATENKEETSRSEDLVILDGKNWSESDFLDARAIKAELESKGLLTQRTTYKVEVDEYPTNKPVPQKVSIKGKGRNKPCHCGSGKKYKKCCGRSN